MTPLLTLQTFAFQPDVKDPRTSSQQPSMLAVLRTSLLFV